MAGYIEKEIAGQYFNPVSSTVEINPASDLDNAIATAASESDENLARWDWLISGWSKMSFTEKIALFLPYMHYVNLRDTYRTAFDETLNTEIAAKSYELCRGIDDIKFDPDRQGIPNILIIYSAINCAAIPDATVRNEVLTWGNKYGFLRSYCCSACSDSDS